MSTPHSEISSACERLVYQFAWHVDHFEHDAALELFTDDLVIEQPGRVISGRNGLAQMFAARPRSRATRHIVTNCLARPHGEAEMCCHSYVTLLAREQGETEFRIAVLADWQDRILRTPSGWRISHRSVCLIFAR